MRLRDGTNYIPLDYQGGTSTNRTTNGIPNRRHTIDSFRPKKIVTTNDALSNRFPQNKTFTTEILKPKKNIMSLIIESQKYNLNNSVTTVEQEDLASVSRHKNVSQKILTWNNNKQFATSTPYQQNIKHTLHASNIHFDKKMVLKKNLSISENVKFDHSSPFQQDNERSVSLEENLFHDVSLVRASKYFSKGHHTGNKFYKLDNSFLSNDEYSDYDDSFERDILTSVNHIKRSTFRQKRREWYLRRYNPGHKTIAHNETKHSRYYFTTWLYFVVSVFQFITRATASILYTISDYSLSFSSVKFNKLDIKKHKDSRLNFQSSANLDHIKPQGEKESFLKAYVSVACMLCLCGMVILLLLPLVFYPHQKNSSSTVHMAHQKILPLNPADFDLRNAGSHIVNGSRRIPVWFIHPEDSTENVGSTVLHFRVKGNHTKKNRIEVYKILTSLGYHVVVPNVLVSQEDILSIWKWMKSMVIKSQMYLWGEDFTTSDMKQYGKTLCNELLPPSGVIIQVPNKYTSLQHRNLEVWSCNCTNVIKENGNYHSYNHVKCPINRVSTEGYDANNNLYNQLVSCLQAVHN